MFRSIKLSKDQLKNVIVLMFQSNFIKNHFYFIILNDISELMKLMKIYEIQKNYQLHKDRLLSINAVNNKVKMIASLQSNINKINNYKRNKIQTQVFNEKEKFDKVASENYNLRSKMMEVNSRKSELLKDTSKNHSSSRSLKSININTKFVKQNAKFRERLVNTKSNYYQVHPIKKRNISTSKRKTEVIYLLEKQLGIKPSVIFPSVKTQNRKIASPSKNRNSRVYTEHNSNTEGLNNKRQKKSLSINYSMDLHRV